MPTLDAANISFNVLKAAADGLPVGPILLGMSKPIHVVVPSVTARGIVNLSALAVVEAQEHVAGWVGRGSTTPSCRTANSLGHGRPSPPIRAWRVSGG